jgi:regulatory protein
MKISKLTAQIKNHDRVNVFIDTKYSFSLTLNQILEQKLKVGTELTEGDIKRLTKLSEDGKMRARALEWVMLRPRSSRELKQYLQKKGVEQALIESILTDFADKKYQNDEYFTKWWVENRTRKLKSNIAIKAELMQKGISYTTIERVLRESSSQKERLKELVAQKKEMPKYNVDPIKFKKYLLSKGFRYSEIEEVLADDNEEEEGNF